MDPAGVQVDEGLVFTRTDVLLGLQIKDLLKGRLSSLNDEEEEFQSIYPPSMHVFICPKQTGSSPLDLNDPTVETNILLDLEFPVTNKRKGISVQNIIGSCFMAPKRSRTSFPCFLGIAGSSNHDS